MDKLDFWKNTKRYYDLKSCRRNRFGCTVHKLQIGTGFTCLNRDGRGSKLCQGCVLSSVAQQIAAGKA